MKTILPTAAEEKTQWFVIDADGAVLGRLASRVATILRGKHKPVYTPHLDVGDGVIIVNAEKVRVTGRKADRKIVYRHSGYPGGLKSVALGTRLRAEPEQVIMDAVKGMLPQTSLGRQMIRKLRIYRGGTHQHGAQHPKPLT